MAKRRTRMAGNTTASGPLRLSQQPLLVAGLGFVLGAALAALVPWPRIDYERLGDQAENLKDDAKELASDGYEKVKSVAQRTYEAATETLRGDENGSGGSTESLLQPSEPKVHGTDTYRS